MSRSKTLRIIDWDKTETLLKCVRLGHCQGTVIKTLYSHKTTAKTTVLWYVRKPRVNGPNGLRLARNASVSAQNKHLATPDRDTVKTQL